MPGVVSERSYVLRRKDGSGGPSPATREHIFVPPCVELCSSVCICGFILCVFPKQVAWIINGQRGQFCAREPSEARRGVLALQPGPGALDSGAYVRSLLQTR